MDITHDSIRAAGGIVHSDGNIFFRDISMLQVIVGAVPAAVTPLPAVLEQIALGWDGCKYDAPGETLDIGADIRAAAKRLLAEQPAAVTCHAEALAKLRHLYLNMSNGSVRDKSSAKRIAEGLLAPAIAELEATPQQPQPR
ncbi:hypothetical protein [Delftia acidovorans]|uniref:hypothetical protein n=1 Tax=Delftia acidovorans TaxID=80866 RepID=UPI002FDDD424